MGILHNIGAYIQWKYCITIICQDNQIVLNVGSAIQIPIGAKSKPKCHREHW